MALALGESERHRKIIFSRHDADAKADATLMALGHEKDMEHGCTVVPPAAEIRIAKSRP